MKNNKPVQRRNSIRRKSKARTQMIQKKKLLFNRADQLSRLELYEKEDLNHPLNQPFRPYAGFNGPKRFKEQRQRTDMLCIPILVLLIGAGILHAIVVISEGSIIRLSNGLDFRGEVCGDDGLVNLPYYYYGSPSKDINIGWCVEECPVTTGRKICMYDIDHFTVTPFCYVQMTSIKVGRYCIPTEPINRVYVDDHMSSKDFQIKRLFSDIYLQASIVKYQIWGAIWGSLLCFASLSWLFWREYERVVRERCLFQIDKHDCGGERAMLFQYLCLISGIVGFGYLVYVMKLFNKINLGIGLIKASSQIVIVLGQLRFFAMFVAAVGFIQFVVSLLVVLYGLTIGNIRLIKGLDIDGGLLYKYFPDSMYQMTLIYPAFMVVLVLLFVLAVNEMFNSYALSVWFFTKKKATVQIPLGVVLKELIFHHLGTCIYFVFIEMAFFIPKWIMYYVHAFLRSLPQTSLIVRFLQGCCLCCLACFQNLLRYISKNALIQVAIWSEPYFISSQKSHFLLSRNQEKIKDLIFLVEFILFQLKLCNSLFLSLPIYMTLTFAKTTPYGNLIADIESPLVPTLFVFLCGFFFISVFQGTYDICGKAVIQLYLMDKEMFYGEQSFIEKFILDFMEFYGKVYIVNIIHQIQQEEKKLYLKTNKQLKFTAKVAPEDKLKDNDQEEEEDDEEDPNRNDDDDDEDDEDYDEDEDPVLDDMEGESQGGGVNMPVKPKMGHLIEADPFELGGQDNSKSQEEEDDGNNQHYGFHSFVPKANQNEEELGLQQMHQQNQPEKNDQKVPFYQQKY